MKLHEIRTTEPASEAAGENRAVRVWAPHAAAIELWLDGSRHAMRREPCGWWGGSAAGAAWDADYGFLVDGEGPFPDPRSEIGRASCRERV